MWTRIRNFWNNNSKTFKNLAVGAVAVGCLVTASFTIGQYVPSKDFGLKNTVVGNYLPNNDTNSENIAPVVSRVVVNQPSAMHMIRSIVGVNGGSGVVLYSKKSPDSDVFVTFVVTNKHVVGDGDYATVNAYSYLRDREVNGTTSYRGRVVGRSDDFDLAIVRFYSTSKATHLANFLSIDEYNEIRLYDPIFVVGRGASNPPFITNGNVSKLELTSAMVSAPAIFGNSGGGVFDAKGRLIGIATAIGMVSDSQRRIHTVPHLCYMVPISLVQAWAEHVGLGFVFGFGDIQDSDVDRLKEIMPEIPGPFDFDFDFEEEHH